MSGAASTAKLFCMCLFSPILTKDRVQVGVQASIYSKVAVCVLRRANINVYIESGTQASRQTRKIDTTCDTIGQRCSRSHVHTQL